MCCHTRSNGFRAPRLVCSSFPGCCPCCLGVKAFMPGHCGARHVLLPAILFHVIGSMFLLLAAKIAKCRARAFACRSTGFCFCFIMISAWAPGVCVIAFSPRRSSAPGLPAVSFVLFQQSVGTADKHRGGFSGVKELGSEGVKTIVFGFILEAGGRRQEYRQ